MMDDILAIAGPAGAQPPERQAMSSARRTNPIARYFGIVRRPEPYLRALYLLTSFPAGLAYFVLLVTIGSVAAGMAVTIVGLPLIVAVMFGWCALAVFEIMRANALAVVAIGHPRFAGDNRMWRWASLKARLTDRLTWRSLALLLAMFPLGIAALVLVSLALWLSAGLVSFPFIAEYAPEGLQFGPDFSLDEWWQGALIALAAPVTFPAALGLFNGAGLVLARFVAWSLGLGMAASASRATPLLARVEAPSEAARTPSTATPAHHRALQIHAWVTGGILGLLIVINALSTPGAWWVTWPAWAFAMPLALHAGAAWRGSFGAHLGFSAALMAGLFIIDANYSGVTWVWWPLLAAASLLALHWSVQRQYLKAAGPERDRGNTDAMVILPMGSPAPEPGPAAAANANAVPAPPPISVDVVMRTVRVAGTPIEVTPREFDLLALLAQNPGRPFSRDDLLDRIWKNDYEVTDRTIDTHIQRLRRKLGQQAEAIETVWGIGYRFRAEDGA